MNAPSEFDVFTCPLDGINLIEASAGTGKTWNICGLYLRLLLERSLEVQKILVVTFTNAATAELRERVRSRIVETLAYLVHGDGAVPPNDPFVVPLVRSVELRCALAPAAMKARLELALSTFDEAAIFTIHGFCQRALGDASFSAALPFTVDAVTDDSDLRMEAVHDFWRRRVAGDSCAPDLAAWLDARGDTPEKYSALLQHPIAKPLARCLWPAAIDRPVTIDTAPLIAAYDAARALWTAQRTTIIELVLQSRSKLNANSYNDRSIASAAADWDAYLGTGMPLAPIEAKAKLTLYARSTLAGRTKGNCAPPAHPFFDVAEDLLAAQRAIIEALGLARLHLLRTLIEEVPTELRRRKHERRVIAFDDMLYNLYAALAGGERPWLSASLRQRFPAALIDEFQDTDPLQFAIFSAIYGTANAPLFLVGDPKQAIYSFRHADLHAYLQARTQATAEYTLGDNQRSSRHLITGLNGLFAANARAFMLPGLAYHVVRLGTRPRASFTDTTLPRADLQVWTLPATADGDPITRNLAKARSVQATAVEIARLLNEAAGARIDIAGRPLRAADIAVLVRSHAQGSLIKEALSVLGVGSVELSQQSVFRTPDAEEVERILTAILEPTRASLLRAALGTEAIGFTADEVAAISADESRLLHYLERFGDYRAAWLTHGVGVMYRRFLAHENVSARILGRRDGERRLTNLLHLGELLHQAAQTHAAPDALLRWLQAQRRGRSADEIAQLRLESDRNLVQIITIHKAKGLEFPIVFCPFLWDGYKVRDRSTHEGREYHDATGVAVIDFRPDAEVGPELATIKERIELEQSSETLRLIYVALTRAIHRCYVIAGTYDANSFGRISTVQSTRSLLNWLVAGNGQTPAAWFNARKSPADIAQAWTTLAAGTPPALGLDVLPDSAGMPVQQDEPAPDTLTALAAPTHIAPEWRIASFSGLASGAKHEAAATDHDGRIGEPLARPAAPPAEIPADDILRFPRGANAGDCLHAIFERIDFTAASGWDDAIAASLATHPQPRPGAREGGGPPLLKRMAARMLADVLATPLPGGITLRSLPLARRLTELEFCLPSQRVTASALNDLLKALGYVVPRLAFGRLEGYLKGFIDLVFEDGGRYYVLDWKSNHLGCTPADYGRATLAAAMNEHAYHLQYLLYTVAVHRYLRHRVPGYAYDTHFGGVFYLFVRGVRPDWTQSDGTATGVYHHRPSANALARLDALLGAPRSQPMS